MSEYHPLIGDQKVATVFQSLGGCGALAIQGQNSCRDKFAVETVSDGVAAGGRHDKPQSVDWFATVQSHRPYGHGAECGNGSPNKKRDGLIHLHRLLSRRTVFRAA